MPVGGSQLISPIKAAPVWSIYYKILLSKAQLAPRCNILCTQRERKVGKTETDYGGRSSKVKL